MAVHADIVLTGGRVFLGLDEGFAEAVAVWGGKVLATGTAEEIAPLVGPQTEVVPLEGRCAIPGINDGHQHPLSLGLALFQIDLRPSEVTTLDAFLARVKEKADGTRQGDWVFGGRYDHFQLDAGRHPHRLELDRVAPNTPVFLKRTCGHMGVANTRALELAGITVDTPDPEGGHIEKDETGLTGLLQERAQEVVMKAMPKEDPGHLVDALEAAGKLFLEHGITSVLDAAIGFYNDYGHLVAFQDAYRQGRLPVRSYLAILGGPAGIEPIAREHGMMHGFGDPMLKIGTAKLFGDGSAGGKTAAMVEPYLGEPDNKGIFIYSDEEMERYIAQYHEAGWQIMVHAIGDACIEQVLTAYEKADRIAPVKGRRHRIEHCGFVTPDQNRRMKALGLIPAPQPVFLYEFGDLYHKVLGPERSDVSYPMRTWMDEGMHPIASSDAPVSDFNPFKNFYTMVTRKSAVGTELGPHQRLTMEEAVSAATLNGAYGSFEEDIKGTLVPGKLADIAVVDRDIFAIAPEEVLPAQVDVTLLDGKIVHDRHGAHA
ncbi:MAG: amidohydrolase [Alphaproteobacteria bacterium]|nr:amidohydrolase [Alphaproteobacteria bacterium]